MEDKRKVLIDRAQELHGAIRPCGHKMTFDECFTETQGKLLFWFNDMGNSTKVEHIEMESDK